MAGKKKKTDDNGDANVAAARLLYHSLISNYDHEPAWAPNM